MAMVTQDRQEKVTVKLSRDVWKAAKIAAAEDEQTLEQMVEGAVEERLEKRKARKK